MSLGLDSRSIYEAYESESHILDLAVTSIPPVLWLRLTPVTPLYPQLHRCQVLSVLHPSFSPAICLLHPTASETGGFAHPLSRGLYLFLGADLPIAPPPRSAKVLPKCNPP